eukprot:961428-Rhodomonas_salina.3
MAVGLSHPPATEWFPGPSRSDGMTPGSGTLFLQYRTSHDITSQDKGLVPGSTGFSVPPWGDSPCGKAPSPPRRCTQRPQPCRCSTTSRHAISAPLFYAPAPRLAG